MSHRKTWSVFAFLVSLSFLLTSCTTPESDWARRDMPTAGLDYLVTYNLTGPAGTEKEENVARFRGVNNNAPRRGLLTEFGRMSGTKTQDVTITLSDGQQVIALGMAKTKGEEMQAIETYASGAEYIALFLDS